MSGHSLKDVVVAPGDWIGWDAEEETCSLHVIFAWYVSFLGHIKLDGLSLARAIATKQRSLAEACGSPERAKNENSKRNVQSACSKTDSQSVQALHVACLHAGFTSVELVHSFFPLTLLVIIK